MTNTLLLGSPDKILFVANFLLGMHRLDLKGEYLLRGQGVRDGHTLEIRSGHAPAFIQKQITT